MKTQTANDIVGIECEITWFDSPDGIESVFIAFDGDNDVKDSTAFYHLTKEEVAYLHKCINGYHDKCSFGGEWFIDLGWEYEFRTAKPTYFTEDGTFGNATDLVIIDTSNWSEEEWEVVEQCSDSDRFETAVNIDRKHHGKED